MKSTLHSQNICFVGAGSMAEAIIRGLLDQQKTQADHIFVVNRHNQDRLASLQQQYRVQVAPDSNTKEHFIRSADIVILAMKPKDVEEALGHMAPLLTRKTLLISVVAGLTIQTITDCLQMDIPIVRTMPNTSSTIGLGATGLSFSSQITPEQRTLAIDIFESIGIVIEVQEPHLDIVTGVSGSGPAYVYYLMESMIRAGIQGGLTPEHAKSLTVQTVLGAASMVRQTQEEPAELRHKVTSPGGTTQAALEILDQHHFSEAVQKAVLRAAERAAELGAAIVSKPNS